uniref:Uncharacterized protein n=1 Tax=Phlebotomus papatasi TaxID=29031 RepID=A0A1B0DRC3_PHLPP
MSQIQRSKPPPRKGGKQRHFCHDFFNSEGGDNNVVACDFCGWTCNRNATRMQVHLTKKCKSVPDDVREILDKRSDSANLISPNIEFFDKPLQNQSMERDMRQSSSSSSGPSRCRMAPEKKKKIDEGIARAVYATSSPFSMFENPYWKAAIKNIDPAYDPPNRKELSGKLLDEEYSRRTVAVDQRINNATSLCIMCDGWSNVRN